MRGSGSYWPEVKFSGGELPVTMHVGMVGTDGVVIVGDTWQHVETTESNRLDYGFHGPKIFIDDAGQMAVATARDMDASRRIVEEIFKTNWQEHACPRQPLLAIAESFAHDMDVELLIIFTHPEPCLWLLIRTVQGQRRCEEIYSAYAIGNAGNPAYFWVMRYYDRNMPMNQLARIGAMVNTSARRFNSGTIDGMEVVECGSGGIVRWNDADATALQGKAKTLTERIGDMIVENEETDTKPNR